MATWKDLANLTVGDVIALDHDEIGDGTIETLGLLGADERRLRIDNVTPSPDSLDVRGTVGGDFPASVRVWVTEQHGKRDCLVLLDFGDDSEQKITGWLGTLGVSTGLLWKNISGLSRCVVSSADSALWSPANLPSDWPADLPAHRLFRGVSFGAHVVLSDGLLDAVGSAAGGALLAPAGAVRIQVTTDDDQAAALLIHSPDDPAPPALTRGFALGAGGATLLLPLSAGSAAGVAGGPRLQATGGLTIAGHKEVVEVEFDLSAETLLARLTSTGGLASLAHVFGDPQFDVPPSLQKALDAATVEAWVLLDWPAAAEELSQDREPILVAGGSVVFTEPIALIDKPWFGATPELDFMVEQPLDSAQRRVSGRLSGKFELKKVAGATDAAVLDLALDLPGGAFTASAEMVSWSSLCDAFGLSDSELPPYVRDAHVAISISGDVSSGVFTATLEVDEPSTPVTGDWTLDGITIEVAYDGTDFQFSISAAMHVLGCEFEVSGGYRNGWFLRGAMAAGARLDVATEMNHLLSQLTLPPGMSKGLFLTDVAFEATLTDQHFDFAVQGRTAGEWTPIDGVKLSVGIDQMRVSRSGDSTSAQIGVSVDAGGVNLLLQGSTPQGEHSGWVFSGGSRPDDPIALAAVFTTFDWGEVPEVLQSFRIAQISLQLDTGSSTATFTCEGQFSADGTLVDATATIRVNSASVDVTVVVTAGDLVFHGKVESSAGGTAMVLALNQGSRVNVSKALGLLVPSLTDLPDVELQVTAAQLVYDRRPAVGEQKPWSGVLVHVALDLGISLDVNQIPALAALAGGGEIGIESFSVLMASTSFPTVPKGVDFVASQDGSIVARSDAAPAVAIPAGAQLAGVLTFGTNPAATVAMPLGATDPAPPDQGPSPSATATAPSKSVSPATKWFPVGKDLGPLHIDKVGGRYDQGLVWLLLTAAVAAGPVRLEVDGLGLGFSIADPTGLPGFTLAGLGLESRSGPMSISASFLHVDTPVMDSHGRPEMSPDGAPVMVALFAGEVSIELPTLSILGAGAYGRLAGGDPTLFLYAALQMADGGGIGQPPFVVTGFAAGFGINYAVVIPKVSDIAEFPLVKMVMQPDAVPQLPAGAAGDASTGAPSGALASLLNSERPSLVPRRGQFFGAIGIRFTLFERVDAFALAVVQAGTELEISLIGLARFKEPREGSALCYVELALLVDVNPSEGVVRIEAQLTPNAWVLDPTSRLTGGFALVTWYAGPHRGDFVLSVGGYHPRFVAPAHYPVVPRLGLNMTIGSLSIKGASYFAVTPSMMMAGGRLEATFVARAVKASFTAFADFLVQWKPLYYNITAGIALHVAVNLGICTFQTSLSVDLALQGPPLHGAAHVHLSVISFTIEFGAKPSSPSAIKEWDEFSASFLGSAATAPAAAPVHQLRVVAGRVLRPGASEPKDDAPWLVRADEFSLATMTAIPASEIVFGAMVRDEGGRLCEPPIVVPGSGGAEPAPPARRAASESALGLRPMGVSTVQTPLLATVLDADGHSIDGLSDWVLEIDRSAMPGAVWATTAMDPQGPPDASTVQGCVVGIRRLKPPDGAPRGKRISALANGGEVVTRLPLREIEADDLLQPAPSAQWTASTPAGDVDRRAAVREALMEWGFAEAAAFGTEGVAGRSFDTAPFLAPNW